MGYSVAFVAQLAGALLAAIIYIQFTNLIFGSCWLFIFIAEDITEDVAAFNIASVARKPNGNRAKLTKRFCDLVQTYSDAKQ